MTNDTIFSYIESKEAEFTQPININGWEWSFLQHVKTSFYYKFGRLLGGNDEITPVKNITRPLLNVQYRTEDIDVKDVVLYVDDPDSYHLSFLVKKYYDDVFIPNNDLDTFFDEINESKVDYGAGLAKKMDQARPERVDLQSIAFCDQTDMMSAPIGLRHNFNPAELKDMEQVGWGNPKNGATMSIDELVQLSQESKVDDKQTGVENKSTGNYIEIYEVHGVLPESYLTDDINDEDSFLRQMHIVGFYKNKENEKRGIILFRKEEKESPFKLHKRDEVYSRALGFGGAEELFESQVWTNNDVIRMNDMLDSASKTILKGIGTDLKSRYPNGLADMDNLSIVEVGEGEDLGQVDTFPRNMQLFIQSVDQWETHAKNTASAQDPLLGKEAPSGTPFRAQERQVIEGKGIHEYRREKYARYLEEIHTDWIIPYIQKEITRGAKFLSQLTVDEMKFVIDATVKSKSKEFAYEQMLSGEVVTAEQIDLYKDKVRRDLAEGGNKMFIEILKGEFKDKPLRVKVSIAGSKNLSGATDKLVNIFRQIIANPQGFVQAMQIPEMAKTFNDILEFSGMTPALFAGLTSKQLEAPQQQQQPQQGGVTPELSSEALQTNATE